MALALYMRAMELLHCEGGAFCPAAHAVGTSQVQVSNELTHTSVEASMHGACLSQAALFF
jgi:hypothetical protein